MTSSRVVNQRSNPRRAGTARQILELQLRITEAGSLCLHEQFCQRVNNFSAKPRPAERRNRSDVWYRAHIPPEGSSELATCAGIRRLGLQAQNRKSPLTEIPELFVPTMLSVTAGREGVPLLSNLIRCSLLSFEYWAGINDVAYFAHSSQAIWRLSFCQPVHVAFFLRFFVRRLPLIGEPLV